MKSLKLIIFLSVLTAGWMACGNDPAGGDSNNGEENTENAEAPESRPVKSLTQAEGSLSFLVRNTIQLNDRTEVPLPGADSDSVTIFMIPPAETMEGKSSLTREGQMRAGKLATLLTDVGIAQIYAEGNAAMQTAMMTSRSNGSELGIFEFDGSDQLVKTILANFKGKKVMVVANPETTTVLLNQLAGPDRYAMATGEYDNMFVVMANEPGKAEIHHLKY